MDRPHLRTALELQQLAAARGPRRPSSLLAGLRALAARLVGQPRAVRV